MPYFTNNAGYEALTESNFQNLRIDDENEIYCKIYGFCESKTKLFFYILLNLLFLGIPFIICSWYPKIKTVIYNNCPLRNCQIILVTNEHDYSKLLPIRKKTLPIPKMGSVDLRYFNFQHTTFVWVIEQDCFSSLTTLISPDSVDTYLENTDGLLDEQHLDLLNLYGENNINVEIKSYPKLFVEEVFNPFYIFQVFSIILWCLDNYYIYAGCVFILTIFSIITALIETRKQSVALHDLVQSSNCQEVTVIRRNVLHGVVTKCIQPIDLVPGDLIILPSANYVMPCDAVLLTGQCIVNESMLTGESVPITKTSLHSSSELYTPLTHKRHTLFSGTHIIQTRYYGGEHVLARVVRTGFNTTKGALVKSILFPTPINLQFHKDSFKLVFVLFVIAAMGMGYCMYLYIINKADVEEIILRSLDIITIVVPPALPAAMTVGSVYSQSRLKKLGIFCISPQRINVCGKIKLACFDKTGTLTHDGLDMHSVIPCLDGTFQQSLTNVSSLDVKSKFVQGMATCHSLTRIDGQLNGDPLDLNMFEFSKWFLEEPGDDENARYDMLAPSVVSPQKTEEKIGGGDTNMPYEIGIIRQYPFSSTLQCMSVICRDLESPKMYAFTKGAPEKLFTMCKPDSLPLNYSSCLSYYTAKGLRVIAMGYKELPAKFKWKDAQKAKRDVIECDLIFLGLLIMQNPLKQETIPVIATLHNAKIRTVMITGDNILTAVSVARECSMVKSHEEVFLIRTEVDDIVNNDAIPVLIAECVGVTQDNTSTVRLNIDRDNCHFAIDGKTWNVIRSYYNDILPSLLVRTTIFARFQPDQKTQLVTCLQKLDYIVSMVGDGANDCGALKAAHVGVSLSQAEASVAAPFTSSIQDISCLVHLMLEGRCALVTSFATFKYMAMYSLIQFFTIIILYKNHSILSDFQFLFIDLIITTSLAITLGRQGPSSILGKKRPMGSLVSGKNLIPLFLQIVSCFVIQLGALIYLFYQDFFKPAPPKHVTEICWESTVLFTVSSFQYVVLALVYSKGKPYRKNLITNTWLLISAFSLIGFTTWLTVYPSKKVAELFGLMEVPRKDTTMHVFRYTLMGFPILHLLIATTIETCIADRTWFSKFLRFIKRKKLSSNKYKLLLNDDSYQQWLHFSHSTQ